MSPALVGGFLTIKPPGKSHICILIASIYCLPYAKHFTNILFHLHDNLTAPDIIPIFEKRELKLREAETLSCYRLSSRATFQPDHCYC